jgi:hypothetical protein
MAMRSARRSAPISTGTITGTKRRSRGAARPGRAQAAAALRLHDAQRGVEEDRHEAERERQREADLVRDADPSERVRDLLDPRACEEDETRGRNVRAGSAVDRP